MMRSIILSLLPLASSIIASSAAAGLVTGGTSKPWPVQTYETVPFTPPQLSVNKSGSPLAKGLIFFTPASTSSAGNIITDDGELVWSTPPGIGSINNLRAQTLDGKPVLTFWNGTGSADPSELGHGFGSVNILDDTYTKIYRICPDLNLVAPNGLNIICGADIHESYITDRGSILITAYNATTANLTSVGGPENGYVWDSLIFEIDIKTQDILFGWSALEHIPVSDTHATIADGVNGNGTASSPFDWCHFNAIQSIGNSYLINSRHLWASYLVAPDSTITWAIKGDNVANGGGDFKLSQNASFSWQHNARLHNITNSTAVLSYFDNHNSDPPFNGTAPTSGKIFSLDFKAGTAALLKNITDATEEVYADSQGSFTPLSNGNYFQGFGQIPLIKEFGPSGDRRLRIQFGEIGAAQSYRAFRREWSALPARAPDVVAKNGTVYVSWNGATNVTDWGIYTGDRNTTHAHFKRVAVIPKTGFETSAPIPGNATFLKAAALANGTLLRESAVIEIK